MDLSVGMPHREEDLYAEFAAQEDLLERLLFGGALGAGILSILQRVSRRLNDGTIRPGLPRRLTSGTTGLALPTTIAIRTRRAFAFTNSTWWRSVWDDALVKALDQLARLSRNSASAALRQLGTLGEGIRADLVMEAARQHARELIAALEADTSAALADALAMMDRRPPGGLIRDLSMRLGPTRPQLALIRRGELTKLAGGMSARDVQRWVRGQTRNAALVRARAFADSAMVTEVTRAELAAWAEVGGVLVFSASVPDNRRRALHKTQTLVTRANPRPAGTGWHPSAPFSGLPQYERGCRCRVQIVS